MDCRFINALLMRAAGAFSGVFSCLAKLHMKETTKNKKKTKTRQLMFENGNEGKKEASWETDGWREV